MGKLIKIQEINEFSKIITIPDQAITETIIFNVRKLDEEKEFEMAIKGILLTIFLTCNNYTYIKYEYMILHMQFTPPQTTYGMSRG